MNFRNHDQFIACCTSSSLEQGQTGRKSCCGNGEMTSVMNGIPQHCMGKCKWIPFIFAMIGVAALALGFFLGAETTRTLWIIISGFAVLMGSFCFLAMSILARKLSRGEKR